MAHTDVPEVLHSLKDVRFPAGKDQLVEAARRAGASEEVVKALRAVPQEEYTSPQDVARSVRTDPDSDLGHTAAQRAEQAAKAASRACRSTCGTFPGRRSRKNWTRADGRHPLTRLVDEPLRGTRPRARLVHGTSLIAAMRTACVRLVGVAFPPGRGRRSATYGSGQTSHAPAVAVAPVAVRAVAGPPCGPRTRPPTSRPTTEKRRKR
ncbi:DUF2795 domain-containing protein [Streptomyces bobili]|uniref:DUF2795 domain-containing protein n=1 Tax=Streptomyces bobili TaxID=67280 RepID=UPI002E291EC4|nr:DUF2795 domain-containing protein [Streptomyces bobili]